MTARDRDLPARSEVSQLAQLTSGDVLTVSARETPMTVGEVDVNDESVVEVTASNRHGEYRLNQYEDADILLRVGELRELAGTVSVHFRGSKSHLGVR